MIQHLQILSFISHLVVIPILHELIQNWSRTLIASIPFMLAISASLFYHFCMWIDTDVCIFSLHTWNRIDTCAASYLVWVFSVYLFPHKTFHGLSLKGALITFATIPHVTLFILGVQDYIIISVYGAVGVVSFFAMYRYCQVIDSIEIKLCLYRIIFFGIIALSCFYSSSLSYTASMYWLTHPFWHLTSFIMIYNVIRCQDIVYQIIGYW